MSPLLYKSGYYRIICLEDSTNFLDALVLSTHNVLELYQYSLTLCFRYCNAILMQPGHGGGERAASSPAEVRGDHAQGQRVVFRVPLRYQRLL